MDDTKALLLHNESRTIPMTETTTISKRGEVYKSPFFLLKAHKLERSHLKLLLTYLQLN